MSGFGAFFGKELHEIRRTWRIWVIPGLILFFAATSPVLALLTPALVSSMAGSQPGLVIQIPPPTAADAYGQFLKNLTQIVLLALIIAQSGTVSGERASGTAVMTLTKPVSRGAFVLAKILSQALLLAAFTALGAAVCAGVTALLFPGADAARLAPAVALWLAYALVLVAVMTLLSAAFASRGAAAGMGLAFYGLTFVLASWPAVAQHTFLGLPGGASAALGGRPLPLAWPLATAALTATLAVVAAVGIFRTKEL